MNSEVLRKPPLLMLEPATPSGYRFGLVSQKKV